MGSDPDDKRQEVEETQTLPASDPPGWVLGVRRPSEEEEEANDDSSPAEAR